MPGILRKQYLYQAALINLLFWMIVMKFFRIFALALSTVAVAQKNQQSQTQGHITGTVVNDDGEAIPQATICTSINKTNSGSTSCGPLTDEHGNFDIAVPLATTGIFAEKSQAGYWHDGRVGSEMPISLTENEPTAHVIIKVGARPAKVNVTATNKNTGKPVEACEVRWITVSDGRTFLTSFKGSFLILIPPNTDLVLVVTAPGYKTWMYSEGSPSEPLRFHSDEERDITAELTPNTQ